MTENLWLAAVAVPWLAVLSWMDIRTRRISHMAWVGLPFLAACLFRLVTGDGWLAGLALLAALASERERISFLRGTALVNWAGAGLLLCLLAGEQSMGCMAVLGFWLGWEGKVWGGADALAAIVLAMLWPDVYLVLSLVGAHLWVVTGLAVVRRSWRVGFIPGMPALLITVLIRGVVGSAMGGNFGFLQWF